MGHGEPPRPNTRPYPNMLKIFDPDDLSYIVLFFALLTMADNIKEAMYTVYNRIVIHSRRARNG